MSKSRVYIYKDISGTHLAIEDINSRSVIHIEDERVVTTSGHNSPCFETWADETGCDDWLRVCDVTDLHSVMLEICKKDLTWEVK